MTTDELVRASDLFDLPLGTLIEDNNAHVWVFIGVSENVAGKVLNFAHVVPRKLWRGENPVMIYSVALPGTALKKFPGLEAWRKL